jgi:Ni/Fe-hydrogenase subunit HybB-like protein
MKARALGGPLLTPTTIALTAMCVLTAIILLVRFVFGLGAVTNLNNGYPWGIWLAYDVAAGTAVACGGFALALVTYALNHGQYSPIMRPAVLASMFGYAMGGFSVLVDISRWWNFWHILWPTYFNFNSVMIEVALCISAYTTILMLEFAPALVEKAVEWTGNRSENLHGLTLKVEKVLNRVLIVIVAVGMTLPTMHQSSLGTLLIPFGATMSPLWNTPMLPFLFLMTALCIGYAMVIFESTLVSDRFSRPSHAEILGQLSKFMMGTIAAFLVVRVVDIVVRGKVQLIFTSGMLGLLFILENLLFIVALYVLWPRERRMTPRHQFIAAVFIVVGGVLYRMDSYIVSYHRPGWSYFPSVPEMLISFGIIAVEILGYVLLIKFLPVLHEVDSANGPLWDRAHSGKQSAWSQFAGH